MSGSGPRLHQLAPSSADLVGRFAKFSRDGRPGGSLPAFASGYVAPRIQTVTARPLLSPPSSTRTAIGPPYSETTLAGAVRAYRVPRVLPEWDRSLLLYRRRFMPMTSENGAPVPTAFRNLTAPLVPSFLTILAEVCLR